jgi:replicative DNA helicase
MTDKIDNNYDDLKDVKLPFDVNNVHEQCIECVRKQLKKYEKHIDSKGRKTAGKFLVPCTGVPKHPVDPALKDTVTDDVWAEMEAVVDIVKWADKYLKLPNGQSWKARWYQEKVLRCSSRRKMLRIARRTGKTDLVCVEICYYLFTEPNIKIVVAGPQKTHTEEIITRVRAFIQSNPMLSSMVIRDVSAPYYEIKLDNGARVRGFAAGTKGKGEGVSIRGQDADRLYLEEMDYIDQKAINGAVLPLLSTSPHTALVGFSTPSGFQTPYYKFCTDNPHYVEFMFNYKVLPHWKNVEMERPSFTEEEWTHEYLAEWGSSEEGVYKPSYIDAALQTYLYGDHVRSPAWRYCIGTDWNEKHGTEIVVVGYNTLNGLYKVVESILVPKSEFTQLSGVEKLLDMNTKWKPSFIYIDAGNGSTNYELLRKTAYEQRRKDGNRDTARILDILKKYDAGSSLKIKDPVTGEEVRSPAKPFMVNASVRMFEQQRISISAADQVLEKQLRNYIVERMTPTKVPVYGLSEPRVGDHRLDALNLALVAFQLEFNDLHIVNVLTSVGAAPDPRTKSMSLREDTKMEYKQHQPEDRRLKTLERTSPLGALPARIDNQREAIKNNRPGWEIDREPEFAAKHLQRIRGRGSVSRGRPSRTNF